MEQVIEVGSIWIGKINRQTELKVMSFNSEKVKVKVLSNGSDVSSVDVIFYMTKDYFLKSYARQVSMEYLKGYEEGHKFGHSDAKKEYEEKYKSEFVEVRQHHYDMGYNDALTHIASEEAENRLDIKKQGFEDGYNTAIKEMKSDKLNSGVCGSKVPNKETQEAIQEVLDKDSNELAGIWVAKDGSGKLKVLSVNEGTCDVELVGHNKVSFFYIGDTATISVDDLKEHWTKELNEFEGIWVSKQHNPDWKIEYYSDCGTHVWMRVLGMPSLAAYVVGDLFTISKERLKSDYTKILEDNSVENTTEDDQLEKELELVEKYPHYYKDIRNLNIIDIYRFFDLFEVTDPCIQHSLKKLAVGGKRGAKDYEKDIKEAMDTLKRWEYMQEENKRGIDD